VTNGVRESFLSLDLFSLTFKNIFFLALLRGRGEGGAIAPSCSPMGRPPRPTVVGKLWMTADAGVVVGRSQ